MDKLLESLQIPADQVLSKLRDNYFDDLKLFIEIVRNEDKCLLECIREQCMIPDDYMQLIYTKISSLHV